MESNQELKQEVFDKIVAALREQGNKSIEAMSCKYRAIADGSTPYGCKPIAAGTVLKCAVGHLIPDSEYLGAYEGKMIEQIIRVIPSLQKYIPVEDLLYTMQVTHDTYSVPEWEGKWERIAEINGLKYTPV